MYFYGANRGANFPNRMILVTYQYVTDMLVIKLNIVKVSASKFHTVVPSEFNLGAETN